MAWRFEIATHYVTRHNTPIHNILSTASQLSISQKAIGMLTEDGNVMPKHVGATIHNWSTEWIIVAFVGFSRIYNEMHGSRSKIPSKKSRQEVLRGGILFRR
jgi:hypothetical protein